jgi:hypothetical protein
MTKRKPYQERKTLLPYMAARSETMLMRAIREFHERFTDRLDVTIETLHYAAWQLDEYVEKNKQYKDAEFLATLLTTIEYIIYKKSGFKWTVKKAKRNMRGRTRGVNQFAAKHEPTLARKHIPISRELARDLADATKIKD